MKNVKITIEKLNILEDISLLTGYLAVKRAADAEGFNRVATAEEDETLLTRFFADACNEIISRLKEFISETNFNGDILELTLQLPEGYDENLTPSLKSRLQQSVLNRMLSLWYEITSPANSETYIRLFNEHITQSVSIIHHRRRPFR